MHDEDSYIAEMIGAGARGYLLKSAGKKLIIDTIEKVYRGFPVFSAVRQTNTPASFQNDLVHDYSQSPFLNEREILLLKFICDELTSEQIAEKLIISKRTVDGLRLRLQDKLNVKNTAGLVKYAIQKGIYRIK